MINNGLVEEINIINNPSKTVLQAIGMIYLMILKKILI